MKIMKQVKCLHCNEIVHGDNGKCACGLIMIVENTIVTEAKPIIDYEDQTLKLLNE